ncbi:MAG: helix-turn-helix domain-containing protein [archaeon]
MPRAGSRDKSIQYCDFIINELHYHLLMWFSQTELKALSEVGKGDATVDRIAQALEIGRAQMYRVVQSLAKKGILSVQRGLIVPDRKTHVNMLLTTLARAPQLSIPLSGTGFQIYAVAIEPKTLSQLAKETGLHKTTLIKKINQGNRISLLLHKEKMYRVNEKVWPQVREFLIEFKKYEESIDPRIPVNAVIYFKNEDEIIFSSDEELDATLTAFSAYENFGIKLYNITYFYYLPKKKLTAEEVFRHSIYVTQKTGEIRHIIFVALFYLKHGEKLSKVEHPIIEKLKRTFYGEKFGGFPSLQEIKDRAAVYDLEVKP